MSWAYNGVGLPEGLMIDLDRAIASYGPDEPTNISRVEFTEAADHIKGLLRAAMPGGAVYALTASGYGTWDYEGTGKPQRKTDATINVSLSRLGKLVG